MDTDEKSITYLEGPRFIALCIMLSVNFFMVSVEISVVATALVSIAEDIGGFQEVSWIMSSYLLGYVSVVIIFAKFSDIFGRKTIMLVCLTIFMAFSAGCGAAQNVTQLIILRAFQGMGGGGCFGMNLIFISEAVPPHAYAKFAAMLGVPAALALGLGPIIGGAISSNTTWRWVFFMNLPAAAVVLPLAILAVPNGFPYHGQAEKHFTSTAGLFSRETWARVDVLGSSLLFLATLSITAGFEEADSRFAWDSAYVISLLVGSLVLWIALLLWERRISLAKGVREPVLPWKFITNRVIFGILLSAFLLGGPATISLFVLPSRFQLVNGLGGLQAGIRLLPFALATPVAAVVGSKLSENLNMPPLYFGLFGGILQVVGFALMSTISDSPQLPAAMYGYQVLAGFGAGAVYQTVVILIPVVSGSDSSVGMGAVVQFRMVGGAIVLAVATSVFNGYVLPRLKVLGVTDIREITSLDPSAALELGAEIRNVLSQGYSRQLLVLCGSASAQTLALLLIWKRKQIQLPSKKA
jgi:MFS family permease